LGKRLVLQSGYAQIQGDFDPYLNLVATADAEDVTVRVLVEGNAFNPDIRFTSQPELPEDEVLAQLLFGRSITDISPFQAAQLAAAVATLAGRGGVGIIEKLRRGIGVDDLDIATDTEGNTGVTVGKYLSENIYTDVTVNSDGSTDIELNIDLTPSLTLRGAVRSDGNTGVGVFFERDY